MVATYVYMFVAIHSLYVDHDDVCTHLHANIHNYKKIC